MLLDFIFPRRCLGCGWQGQYFCQDCRNLIKPIERQICPVCQKPSISGTTHFRCQTRYSLNGLVSVFAYEGAVRSAITKLKYKFVTDLAEELIDLTVGNLKSQDNSSFIIHNSFTLIPVPLHWRRKRQRGFNQAELLGQKLAERFSWQFQANVLSRIRYTRPQVELKSKDRRENIRGAFIVNSKCPHFSLLASPLLVFDDVWTTGSTLKECALVLKKAGAGKVWGLTLAR